MGVVELHELVIGPVFHDLKEVSEKLHDLRFLQPLRDRINPQDISMGYFNVETQFGQELFDGFIFVVLHLIHVIFQRKKQGMCGAALFLGLVLFGHYQAVHPAQIQHEGFFPFIQKPVAIGQPHQVFIKVLIFKKVDFGRSRLDILMVHGRQGLNLRGFHLFLFKERIVITVHIDFRHPEVPPFTGFRRFENVHLRITVKIKAWRNIVNPQRFLHGGAHERENHMFVFELHFRFLRMDIYINLLRIQFQIKKESRYKSGQKQAFKGFLHCFVQIRTAEKPAVYKKELFAPHFFRPFRLRYKAVQLYPPQVFLNGNKERMELPAKNLHDTLHL